MKTKKDIPTLVIDCNRWVRGGNKDAWGTAKLFNELGNKCCLGFDCEQNRGVPYIYMAGVSIPAGVDAGIEEPFDSFAAQINDNPDISDRVRMKRLRKCMEGKRKLIFKNKPAGC